MTWKIDGPEGNETAKVHDRIAPFVSGRGLDLGCGPWKLEVPKTGKDFCLGVDGAYFGQAPCVDVTCDVTKLDIFADESFDYIYSSHTLEDMPYPAAVLKEWWRVVKPGGRLILYLPLAKNVAKEMGLPNWQDFYANKGEIGANPHHEHDYFPSEIQELVANCGPIEVLVDEVRGEKEEYSFLQVYRKLASSWPSPMIQCLCRYHRMEYEKSMEQRTEGMENEVAFFASSEGNTGTQSPLPAQGQEESLAQKGSSLVQDSR